MSAASHPRVVVATSNQGKLVEIRALLGALPAALCSLESLPPVELPEEGDDYALNAVAKARAVAEQLGEIAVADDSGLEVDGLDGRPGVYSARYGGPGLDDAGRVARLLDELQGCTEAGRTARFVCVAALVTPAGGVTSARGECVGRILAEPSGAGGFGYDPVFMPEGFERSMAELTPEEKDGISHRGNAFRGLRGALRASLAEHAGAR